MDNTEDDDARYPPKNYSLNHRSNYTSTTRSKQSNRNPYYENDEYDDYEDDDGDDELGEQEHEMNHEFDDQDDEDDDDDDDDEDEDVENGYGQKKRRLENLVNNYEFVPRNRPNVVQNSVSDWSDHATFVLLEGWGERFLQLGRKSLRSEDWQEVAEKVSEGSKTDWTDAQCRNRLDTLKKKYKKERERIEGGGGYASKWVFFKKMDMLLNSTPGRQQGGLPCGVDSGEYVFMNPRVYLNRSNGLDEMRDSPGEEEEEEEDDEDSDGLPPRRRGLGGESSNGGVSFGLLADSIQKFGEIYEKIENNKRQQMVELEKMRMDFQRELEVQKKQILDRAHAEIAKIQEEDDDDDDETDGSTEIHSG